MAGMVMGEGERDVTGLFIMAVPFLSSVQAGRQELEAMISAPPPLTVRHFSSITSAMNPSLSMEKAPIKIVMLS